MSRVCIQRGTSGTWEQMNTKKEGAKFSQITTAINCGLSRLINTSQLIDFKRYFLNLSKVRSEKERSEKECYLL